MYVCIPISCVKDFVENAYYSLKALHFNKPVYSWIYFTKEIISKSTIFTIAKTHLNFTQTDMTHVLTHVIIYVSTCSYMFQHKLSCSRNEEIKHRFSFLIIRNTIFISKKKINFSIPCFKSREMKQDMMWSLFCRLPIA